MKKLVGALAVAACVFGLAGSASAQAKAKRHLVAVTDFDYGTVNNWWGQYDIGKGLADQVMNALVEDGTFRVVERKKLDTVLAEQDFAQSDRADPSAAKLSKMGKVLGVRFIITGSVTKFSNESRGGSVRVKGIGLGGKKAKSTVAISVRLVDTTTGEVLLAAKGEGESGKGGGDRRVRQGCWRRDPLGGVADRGTSGSAGAGGQQPRGPDRREEGPSRRVAIT